MTTGILLRAASLLAALQYAAHSSLFLLTVSKGGPDELKLMAANSRHSYWDLYLGYGLLAILSGVIEVVLLWQLASIARTNNRIVRPVTALFLFANVAHALLVWRYFSLWPPVTFDLGVGALLGFALITPSQGSDRKITNA